MARGDISFIANSSGLTPGEYLCNVHVTDVPGFCLTDTIHLHMTVLEVLPEVGVGSTEAELYPVDGGSDCDTLAFWNSGQGALEWSFTDTCAWVYALPESGTTAPGETTEVAFCTDDISGLPPLTQHYCEFGLESNDPGLPSIPFGVTIEVQPASGLNDLVSTRLEQNYPNPFNPVTEIPYSVAEAGRATIRIYDLSGRAVRTLVDENRRIGAYAAIWDGREDSGLRAASGVYYCRLEIGGRLDTRKLVLLK